MTDEEKRRRWYATLEQSRALLDAKVPEPTRDLFRPDALERWARNMPTIEAPNTAPVPAPIDWAAVDERIEAAIGAEHEFVIEVVGNALGESLRDQRQESKDELAAEVRKLWAVLTEMQVTLAALARLGVTKATEPLDLPALPRGRDRDLN